MSGTVALFAGLALLAIGLEAAGYDGTAALRAIWSGAFGSWYAFASGTLVRSVPLILIGLGIALAFKAGALNIGAEGQFAAGAIVATWLGVQASSWPGPIAVVLPLVGGIVGGAVWVAIPVWLRLRFGVLEVITTLLLNFVADALLSLMVQGPLQEARGVYPQSDPIAEAARLGFFPGTRLHWGFLVAILLALIPALGVKRTWWGFQLRATGANPRAAAVSGRINVGKVLAFALLLSGMLAGLAGSMEVTGVTFALYQNLSPGYGFTAIAVALLARLSPWGVVFTGLLFAALETGASAMQRDAGIPAASVYVVEAIIIVVVLLTDSLARRAARTPSAVTGT